MRRNFIYVCLLVVICIIAIVFYRSFAHKKVAETVPEKQADIKKNIDSMTVDEKIGQMVFAGIDGTEMTSQTKQLIHEYKVGGIILFSDNIESQEQTATLLEQLNHENTQNKSPLFLGVDQEGGRVERLSEEVEKLPTAAVIGEKNDSKLSFEFGKLLSRQVQLYGFNLNFAPVLDVNSNPNNPVIGDRAFGNIPDTVTKHGVEVMRAIQSEHVIPVIKHFPGHGDTDTDSHTELPRVDKSLQEIEELELRPFKNAIEAGADVVMTAHILLPEIDPNYPASISKHVIHDILRKDLAFDGVVMTDDMTMAGLTNHFEIGDAAVRSVQAGSDIILVAHEYETIFYVFHTLKTAVENEDITEERLDESVERIIKLKEDYQLETGAEQTIQLDELNKEIKELLKK